MSISVLKNTSDYGPNANGESHDPAGKSGRRSRKHRARDSGRTDISMFWEA